MPPRAPASVPRARWYGRQRRQSGSSRLRFFFQRDLHVENRPLPRLAFDADVASEQGHALAQAHQAESIRPARIVEIEAAAVVPDVQRHGTVGAPERDFDALRLGVPGDVGERLLQDAEYRGGVRILEFEIRRGDAQLAGDPRALGEFLHQPLGGRYQPQVVEYQWAQIRGDAPSRGDGAVDHRLHCVELLGDRGVPCRESLREPGDIELQGGERLPQLVVEFPGDAPLLLFPDRIHGIRELAHPALGAPPRLPPPDPLGRGALPEYNALVYSRDRDFGRLPAPAARRLPVASGTTGGASRNVGDTRARV